MSKGSRIKRYSWFIFLLLPVICMGLIIVSAETTNTDRKPLELPKYQMVGQQLRGAVRYDDTNLYAEASTKQGMRETLQQGAQVDPIEYNDDWCRVKTIDSDLEGFVKTSRLLMYDATKKHIALTFDDGPSLKGTKKVLDIMEKYDAKATFFMLGSRITEDTESYVTRAEELGCEVGNHSYDHSYLPTQSKKGLRKQFGKTDDKIEAILGHPATVVRPPYGAYNKKVKKIADRPIVLWSIDTLDWKYKKTKRLVKVVKKKKHDGAVILMHDIHPTTVAAVEKIVKHLQKKNYELVTVSDLALITGNRMVSGSVYGGK